MSKEPLPWPEGEPWFTDPTWPERENPSGLDYWRLCEDLSVIQAALLVVGTEPTSDNQYEAERGGQPPVGYQGARDAIERALLRGAIAGDIVPRRGIGFDGESGSGDWIRGTVDIFRSTVEVESLKKWLAARGAKTGFFFPVSPAPQPPQAADAQYLDRKHKRYAPKLAAAVHAWLAMEDKSALKGKSPKQAMANWIRDNASRFELTTKDGKLNESGIEEAAKVANWQPEGGAPKTP